MNSNHLFKILSYRVQLSGMKATQLLLVLFLIFNGSNARAQWLDWSDETATRLTLSSVANSDGEEKDMWAADLNNDGKEDLIVVRKQPFSTSSQPGKSNLLLMNINGQLIDQTLLLAPEFISTVNFARDVYIGDFDGDNWKDVIVANTFGQQPLYYKNRGNDISGHWLGLINESALRFPVLTEDTPLFCAVWGGDVNGDLSPDIYFVNYKVNSGGGTAKDFLLINDGTGHFTNESQTRLGTLRNSAFGTAVQITDMDNDGDNDIVKNTTLYNVAPWNARGVIVLFNDGTGNFINWQNLVPTSSPYMFEIADFNMDGNKDLFVVDDGSDYILTVTSIVANTSLTFTKTNLNFTSTNGFGGNVHAADLDLDGDLDIGVADVDVDIPPCNSSRRMAIYKNNGGVFSDPYGSTIYSWADNSYDFAWIDINNDGLKDFVTGFCAGYGIIMSDNCGLAPVPSDYDQDGLADACDPCPTNPDPNCAPSTNYPTVSTNYSIARQWNELLLASIRRDFARPTVHARNLFHISSAMWDAWSVYDIASCEFLLGKTVNGFTCPFNGIPASVNIADDRAKAISYASYRLLRHRFANSPQAQLLYTAYNVHMDTLGYDTTFTSFDYSTGNAAALGNYIAQCYINYGLQDGSNEQNSYANTSYAPVNPPLNVDVPGNPNIVDVNRWQPLTLDLFIDQSGNQIPGATPPFLSPEWGQVKPFALKSTDLTTHQRNGFDYKVYHDPGTPPQLLMDGSGTSEQYKFNFSLVSVWSSHLDPDDGVMWDISPATQGNRNILPASVNDYPNFYNLTGGGTTNVGHALNPVTGQPYAPNIVARGDYSRVLAEFWADGPDSETPPGHWFTLFNYVSDHPLQTKKYKGTGTPLNDLEWDVKGYFALGGTMHDVAITAWGMKGWYDYIRPISAIRAMAELGQSSDPGGLSYHPAGLPLIPGYIELVLAGDSLAAGGSNVGKIKLFAWRGHSVINNVDVDHAGSGWILAENWLPYQRPSFVTPPFAGFISGHSTYSRAAAEILTDFTGNAYFPGGLGEFVAEQDEFLVFENGPSQDVHLQWATYQDAADESSLSRIWGGIHPPIDDIPGRLIAVEIAEDAFIKAESYFGCCTATAPAKPGTISAPLSGNKVCPGDTKIYSISNVAGATSYTWVPPVGGIIVSGQGTNSVTVNYTSAFVANDSIKVAANKTCATSAYRALSVKRNNPATPGAITGPLYGVCNLTNVPYSVSNVAGITYNWNFTTSVGTIAGGQGTNSITANLSSVNASGNLTVTGNNNCGTSAVRSAVIRTIPATPTRITGPTSFCALQQGVPYSIVPVASATAYVWTSPTGSKIFDGSVLSVSNTLETPSANVTVNYGTLSGKIGARAKNACGSSGTKTLTVTANCREYLAATNNVSPSEFDIQVYPNPSSDEFVFDWSHTPEIKSGLYSKIQVYDILGKEIYTNEIASFPFTIKTGILNSGIYTALIQYGDKMQTLKLIKID
ncbi:MAG: VCBS repeat-containing protein [Bacteroidetes bacterium]|nr:VCBS repeat-containing protein [Bacteroidota bacterium]